MSTLHLACGSSPEYLPHAAAMIHSAAAYRGDLALEVHYLHGPALRAGDRDALRGFVEALGGSPVLHEIADDAIAGLPAMEHIPATMWYRTFLPELLPGVDRILYLDADTIVLDSLDPLWSTDLGDCLLGAVTNVWEPWNEGYPTGGLGLAARDDYFNSGVLLMDLAGLRAEACARQVLDWARGRDQLPWGDQDALNAVLAGRRLALHPRWNCMNSVLEFPQAADVFGADAVAEARGRPAIRHFEGPLVNKPWHAGCERALRELYLRHRRETPWPEVDLEGTPAPPRATRSGFLRRRRRTG